MQYPNAISKSKTTIYSNRGMNLEYDINVTNEYYLTNDIAVIYKKPTPITINKVDYPSRKDAVIKEAHFKTPSTTDYNGIYKGKYIDFEAKETKLKSFPLQNIHKHQLDHLEKIVKHGGIGFVIVAFTSLNEVFLLPIENFINYITETKKKSIPYTFFKEKGYLIEYSYNPRLDYLKIIDKIYFKGDVAWKSFGQTKIMLLF